jgi:hypothetical protein
MRNLVPEDSNTTNTGKQTHYIYDEFENREQIECFGFGECEYCGVQHQIDSFQDLVLGQILTVVDASVTDPVQNKSMKDLMKSRFYDGFSDLNNELRQVLFNCTSHKANPSRQVINQS